jgi:hypothetical protein
VKRDSFHLPKVGSAHVDLRAERQVSCLLVSIEGKEYALSLPEHTKDRSVERSFSKVKLG